MQELLASYMFVAVRHVAQKCIGALHEARVLECP